MNRPSVSECIQGFERILDKINPQQMMMLQAHYHSGGRAATMRELATAAGYPDFKMANLQYGNLAKRLYQAIDYPKPKSPRSGKEYWILGLGDFVGRQDFGLEMQCVMRPEIAEALERMGIVGHSSTPEAPVRNESMNATISVDETEVFSPAPEPSAFKRMTTSDIPPILQDEGMDHASFEPGKERPRWDILENATRVLVITGKGDSARSAHAAIIQALDGGRELDREKIDDLSVLTQNIDGSYDLLDLYGDLNEARCLSCGHTYTPENSQDADWHPSCPKCDDFDSVIRCGKMLDDDELQQTHEKALQCEFCVVAGSSDVSSAAIHIAKIAKQAGGYLIEINEEETELTEIADGVLRGYPFLLFYFMYCLSRQYDGRDHDHTAPVDLTLDSNIQKLRTSETHPIGVDFIRGERFPLLNRLGMVFAPGLSLDEGEAGRLQLGDVASEDDITLIRLQVPADKAVPDSMTDVVTMAANCGKALRQGETVIVHCKDNQAFVSLTAACIALAATDTEVSASEAIELVREAHPGAIESEAQEQFIEEFEKEWQEVMAKRGDHYLLYWQERSVLEHASNELPLDVVASNGLFGVEEGDTLWIVTLTQDREFWLAGRLVVGEIVEYEEAMRRMPDAGLWQAEYYAFPELGTEELLRPVSLLEIAEELRFDGENDRLTIRDGQINPQQLRKRRKLTPESAELVASIWEESAPITDPEELVAAWQEVVEANPEDPQGHYNLAVALDEVERTEEAIYEYQETIRLDPNYFPALYNLGNYLVHSGEFDEAIEMFNRAILVDGDYAAAHFMLGVAYFESGRFDDAVAATQQGLEIDPDDESAYYNIAYWTYRMGDYQSALARCDDVIARFPFYSSPHVLKGMCFRELSEIDNEIQSYKDAVNIKVDDEGAFIINFTAVFFLGAAWERKMTGSDEGIEYIEADNHFDLHDPMHQFCWAMGHLAQGDGEAAAQWIEGLLTSAPDLAGRLERAMLGRQPVVVSTDQASILADSDAETHAERFSRKERTAIRFVAGDETFTAKNIPDLYRQILKFLVECGDMNNIELPFATGPKRYLIAREPIHPSGQKFMTPVEYEGYFMEAHNNRTAAISNLEKLKNALEKRNSAGRNREPLPASETEPIVIDFGPEYRPTSLVLTPDEETKLAKFKGCLLAGAVGDALGAAIEFDSLERIRERFGEAGLTDYALAYGRIGAITDDTQMTLFTAEGLIRAYMRFSEKGICHPSSLIHKAYLRWLHTQRIQVPNDDSELPDYLKGSWLLDLPGLNIRRAPGNTCLTALRSGVMGTVDEPINNSKGCGGVMRVAPVGLLALDPFNLATEAAAITHGHPAGYLTAGVLAWIVSKIIEGSSLFDAINQAVYEILPETKNHKETFDVLDKAIKLAQDRTRTPSPELIETLGGGWVGEEALAISIYCSLVLENDLSGALLLAVNHSGDSDSTGAITGTILGALHGLDAIPIHWLDPLELRKEIEQVAADLHAASLNVDLSERYPGW